MNLDSIFSKIGVPTNLVQDVTLLLAIIFASFVFGMFIGRHRLITILINIYISSAILAAAPKDYLDGYIYQLGFFFASIIALTLFGKRLFEIRISGSGSGFLWRVFAMSFLEVMMIASIIAVIVPKKTALSYLSASSYSYLASPEGHFIWLVAPLIFIFTKLNR